MNITDHMDQVSRKEWSFGSKVLDISFECSSGLFNNDNWTHGAFCVVDDGNDCISYKRSIIIFMFYVSMKCHSFQISILYCFPLRSSGHTADSIKVLVLLSQRLLMARVSYLKSTEALGSSWLSLISAMAAVSMCPTSHQERMKAGRQVMMNSLSIFNQLSIITMN